MMRYFQLAALLLSPTLLLSQSVDTLYYNNLWKLTDRQNASFIRLAEVDSAQTRFVGPVTDFYPTGEIFMKGNYSAEGKKQGEFNWYYANGASFMQGQFSVDSITGTWKMYFSTGQLRQSILFTGNDFVFLELTGSNGEKLITSGTGELREIEVGVNPTIYVKKGAQVNGKRVGKWNFLYETGNGYREYVEEYKAGLFYVGYERNNAAKEKYYYSLMTSQLYYPPNLRIMEAFEKDAYTEQYYRFLDQQRRDTMMLGGEVFTIVEHQPEYPGGMGQFYQLIVHNLRYPQEARRMGIEGKVMVQFVINEDGSVSDVVPVRGIGAGCDEEAVRVVKLSQRWLPGLQRGKPVKVRMVIPVTFRLG